MKSLHEVKIQYAEIEEDIKELKKNPKLWGIAIKRQLKKLEGLKEIIHYLETNPDYGYVNATLYRLKKSRELIMDQKHEFMKQHGIEDENNTESKKLINKYLNDNNMQNINKKIKALQYIIS